MHSGHLQHTEKFTNCDLYQYHSHSTVSTQAVVDMSCTIQCCWFHVFLMFLLGTCSIQVNIDPDWFKLTIPAMLAQLRSTLQCDSAGTSGSDVGIAQPMVKVADGSWEEKVEEGPASMIEYVLDLISCSLPKSIPTPRQGYVTYLISFALRIFPMFKVFNWIFQSMARMWWVSQSIS